MKKIRAWLKLLSVKNIGLVKSIRLVETLGEPDSFLGNMERLEQVDFLSQQEKIDLSSEISYPEWDKIEILINKFDIKFISILDDLYPPLLKTIFHPPPFLFYRGNLRKDDFRRTISIVGTRKPSNYGKLQSKKIASNLARSGFTIISGLAYGVDTLAHQAALESGGRTIAILATGCEQIYPPQNKILSEKILKNGAIITEYLPGVKVERWHFPTRNRIISGLSLGTLVIEGSKKSGALLTAKFATDQNRDIFALPGDITRPQAEGPNYLIKIGGNIISSANDIKDFYNIISDENEQMTFFPELSKEEDKIYQILLQNKPEIDFDNLLIKASISIGELSSNLLILELKNLIKRLPGNKISPLF